MVELLPRPHGFEGLLARGIPGYPAELSAANDPNRRPRRIDRNPGVGHVPDQPLDRQDPLVIQSCRLVELHPRSLDDLREVMSRREMYRRLSRIGDLVHIVAERVWYAVVKEA